MAITLTEVDTTSFPFFGAGTTLDCSYTHPGGSPALAIAVMRTVTSAVNVSASYGGNAATKILDHFDLSGTFSKTAFILADPSAGTASFRFATSGANISGANIYFLTVGGTDLASPIGGSDHGTVYDGSAPYTFTEDVTAQASNSTVFLICAGEASKTSAMAVDSPLTALSTIINADSGGPATIIGYHAHGSAGTHTYTGSWTDTDGWSNTTTFELLQLTDAAGSAVQTIPSITCAGTSKQAFKASAVQTLYSIIQIASALTLTNIDGSIVQTLPAIVNLGTAAVVNPIFVAQTLPPTTNSITAKESFIGTMDQAIANLLQAGTAKTTFDSDIVQTVGVITQSIDASAGASAFAAAVVITTLPDLTQTSTAVATNPGSAQQILPNVSQTLIAATKVSISGQLVQTLPNTEQYVYTYVSGSPTYERLGVGSEDVTRYKYTYRKDEYVGKRRVTDVKKRFGVG